MKDVVPLSDATVNKHLTVMGAFADWAERHGYLDKNPFRKLAIKSSKRASEERLPFDDDDLKAIFSNWHYKKNRSINTHSRYWVPLIALHSGMRLNEICQLRKEDVREDGGVWVFDINDDDSKSLKTKAAKRVVPIHSKLIELGFLDYVGGIKSGCIWPDLQRKKDGTDAMGSWFSRYLREKVGITSRRKVFHSFRHTVITRLKIADVAMTRVSELVGHEVKGETASRYGKAYDAAGQKEVIEKLHYDLTELDGKTPEV